jgi:hypothetical protein
MRAPKISLLLVLVVGSVACGGKTEDGGGSPDGGGTVDTGGTKPDTAFGGTDASPGTDTGVPLDGARPDTLDEDFTRCSGPGTCVAVPRTCCGSCGAATPDDVIGVDTTRSSAYRTAVCGPGTGCPACFRPVDPFLQAFCRAGHCEAVDLHKDAMTACTTDDDCQLRYEDCCESCGAPMEGLIALRRDAVSTYRAEVCAPDAACPKCAVSYPAGARALCDGVTKHCAVGGTPLPD